MDTYSRVFIDCRIHMLHIRAADKSLSDALTRHDFSNKRIRSAVDCPGHYYMIAVAQ